MRIRLLILEPAPSGRASSTRLSQNNMPARPLPSKLAGDVLLVEAPKAHRGCPGAGKLGTTEAPNRSIAASGAGKNSPRAVKTAWGSHPGCAGPEVGVV